MSIIFELIVFITVIFVYLINSFYPFERPHFFDIKWTLNHMLTKTRVVLIRFFLSADWVLFRIKIRLIFSSRYIIRF